MSSQSSLERRSRLPIWVGLGGVLALVAARLSQVSPLPIPRCGLLSLTGVPCPFCGSTRCLIAWSRLDLVQAFSWNPLVATAGLCACAWLVICLLDRILGRTWGRRISQRLRRQPWPAVMIGAVILNWIYLWTAAGR